MNKFLRSISQSRLIVYALIAGSLPILFMLYQLYSYSSEVSSIGENISYTYESALIKEKKQATNKAVMNHYQNADRFYIDKNIESITLLKPETESLEKIARQNNFIENEAVTNRLNFLKEKNSIVFAEGVVQSYPYFTETLETLVHPVETDLNDLQNILAKIEGIDIGPYQPGPNPLQLLITDFKLEKKYAGKDNEIFNLNLKLLKREYSTEP
ncbi:MAG: hypothetical protein K940chlam3_00090 [Chlamydiae bacterium]|nr:hypothetical protein [Chlamydiota bacterium]